MSANHGTRARYANGCRCADCTEANTQYRRKERGPDFPVGPAWVGHGSYTINPLLVPDTMTRSELMRARGYE